LKGKDILKFMHSDFGGVVTLKECKTKELPKQIAAATAEGARKGGRQTEGWRGEVKAGLNIMRINKPASDGKRSFFYCWLLVVVLR
jgi:hypothetical protein